MNRQYRQRGDTIVEVLICVLIVSMVLAGAYVTTQRSSSGIRNSQEHAEALKLIQSQIEQLRSNAAAQPTATVPKIFTISAQPFCMVAGEPVPTTEPPTATGCVQNAAGQPTEDQPAYEMSIFRTKVPGCNAGLSTSSLTPCYKFSIQADWEAITGNPAYEKIFYRLHQ